MENGIIAAIFGTLQKCKENTMNCILIVFLLIIFSGTLIRLIHKFFKFIWTLFIMQWTTKNQNDTAKSENLIHYDVDKNANYNLKNNNLSLIEIKILELLTKNSDNNNFSLEKKIEQKMQFHNLEQKMMIKDLEFQMKQKMFEIEMNQKINSLSKNINFNVEQNKEVEEEQQRVRPNENEKIANELQIEIIERLKEINQNEEDIKFCILTDKKKETYYNNDEKTLYINPYDLFLNANNQENKYLKQKN